MPPYRPHKRKEQPELLRPLKESDRILELTAQTAKQFNRELEEGDFQQWLRDLSHFSLQAIEWAFDAYRKGGRFFPQPVDIRDLCKSWEPSAPSRIIFPHHGQGYGSADIDWLWKAYANKRARIGHRALSETEVNALLDELDKRRGRSPAWRTA